MVHQKMATLTSAINLRAKKQMFDHDVSLSCQIQAKISNGAVTEQENITDWGLWSGGLKEKTMAIRFL